MKWFLVNRESYIYVKNDLHLIFGTEIGKKKDEKEPQDKNWKSRLVYIVTYKLILKKKLGFKSFCLCFEKSDYTF